MQICKLAGTYVSRSSKHRTLVLLYLLDFSTGLFVPVSYKEYVHMSKLSKKFSLRRTRYNSLKKRKSRKFYQSRRKSYGAGIFDNLLQKPFINNKPASSWNNQVNFSRPSSAFQYSAPQHPQGILSVASSLAAPFLKSMSHPNSASMFPAQAHDARQIFSQARPLLTKFQQDPQGTIQNVLSHPLTQQFVRSIAQHIPVARQAIQSASFEPQIDNASSFRHQTRNGTSYNRQANEIYQPESRPCPQQQQQFNQQYFPQQAPWQNSQTPMSWERKQPSSPWQNQHMPDVTATQWGGFSVLKNRKRYNTRRRTRKKSKKSQRFKVKNRR